MRLKSLLAAAFALVCVSLAAPTDAQAFGDRERAPAGWGHARTINHWVYYPRYRHNYHVDPYAYQHSPRGYYPYYNAGYWKSAHDLKARKNKHYNSWNVQAPRYKYHPSWGAPKHWHHHEWHKENHGFHHRWHW